VTLAEAVLDASAVVRGLTAEGDAAAVLDDVAGQRTRAHAPDLVVAEVANALAVAVRADRRSLPDAQALLGVLAAVPMTVHASTPLAPAALELAAEGQLSAYDALYAVLSRALDVPLVTADRRLAAAVPDAVLVAS
jgi:predicted nucleic acid-binding protein